MVYKNDMKGELTTWKPMVYMIVKVDFLSLDEYSPVEIGNVTT
jgi:hypothetical protein